MGILNKQEFEEMLRLSSGRQSVPQIFIDEQHIGGYDDLVEFDMDGNLNNKTE